MGLRPTHGNENWFESVRVGSISVDGKGRLHSG
jgi:hypothetical protein